MALMGRSPLWFVCLILTFVWVCFIFQRIASNFEYHESSEQISNYMETTKEYRPGEAYVILCTEMRYVYPTLVLLSQLNSKQTYSRDFMILIPEELDQQVSPLLEHFNIKRYLLPKTFVIPINYSVQSPTTKKRDRVLWNKLYAWKLTQYSKILLLDVDILILKPIDELFTLTSQLAGVAALSTDEKILFWEAPKPFDADSDDPLTWRNFTKVSNIELYHSGLNGGVLLIQPDENVFQDLLNTLANLSERTCCPMQEFIFRYFELRGQYHRLPPTYNMRKVHKIPEADRSLIDIKVYHFVEKNKPWLMGRKAAQEFRFAREWWEEALALEREIMGSPNIPEELMELWKQVRQTAICPSIISKR